MGANTLEGRKEMSTHDLVRAPQQTAFRSKSIPGFCSFGTNNSLFGLKEFGSGIYHLLQEPKMVRFSYQVFKIVHHLVVCHLY